MEHFKDNSGCSGPKKSEIFWNNSRKVQYVFAGEVRCKSVDGCLVIECFRKCTIFVEQTRTIKRIRCSISYDSFAL